MGREVFKYNEVDGNNFQKVNQSNISLEIYHTATYATSSATDVTLPVAERGGFLNSDKIYVGTDDETISGGVAAEAIGSGDFTILSTTFANNDAVILYDRPSLSPSGQHATVYDDPDFVKSIDQTVAADILLDDNN